MDEVEGAHWYPSVLRGAKRKGVQDNGEACDELWQRVLVRNVAKADVIIKEKGGSTEVQQLNGLFHRLLSCLSLLVRECPQEWSDGWAKKALEWLKSPESVEADVIIKGKVSVLPKSGLWTPVAESELDPRFSF
ncbi:unnamed protein product [Haemonchus placei]|uniref:Pecanex-like protein n=1 Tax=Haemonchus placei TaxID=6290 RepID=A0A0N4WGZ1_HAEPC|nr:unnamed protein product [Haemonchus placei]